MENMTWERWKGLSDADKETTRDYSELSPQLKDLKGYRVEVETLYGETRRFIVGQSTGWKPINLEVKTRRSYGGVGAEREYKSVKILYKVR